MKKYLCFLFAAVALVFFAGCSNDDDQSVVDSSVVGEWHLTQWNSAAQTDFEVYIEFLASGKFNLYQQVETSAFVGFSGDFSVAGGQLSGRYDDGKAWSTTYDYALSSDGKTLTMTSHTDLAEVSVYTRTTIPSSVRSAVEARAALPVEVQPVL